MIVVAVRLVRNPRGRPEMDPARHRAPGRFVDDGDVHPVAARFGQFEADPAGLGPAVALEVAPAHPAELVAAPPHGHGRRRQGGDRRERGLAFRRPPAGAVVRAWQRLRVRRHAPVDVDVEHAFAPVAGHQPDRHGRPADERVLVNVAGGDGGDDEAGAARHELDPLDRSLRMRILPAPQVIAGRVGHRVLGQARPRLAPGALEPRQLVVLGVGDGQERLAAPARRHHLDLEPLPDRGGHDLAAGQVEAVLGDRLPDRVAGRPARLEQPVRDDHPRRQAADRDRDRGGGQQEARTGRRRLRPDQERQAAQLCPAEGDVAGFVTEDVEAGVAGGGQVDGLIARHGSDRRLAAGPIPLIFRPVGAPAAARWAAAGASGAGRAAATAIGTRVGGRGGRQERGGRALGDRDPGPGVNGRRPGLPGCR